MAVRPVSVFPGYGTPAALRWRQPRSWKELEKKKIEGVRVRWTKSDAFLHKAPPDKQAHREYPVALSADGQLDDLTEWRDVALVETFPKSVRVRFPNGMTMLLSSLDSFEILVQQEDRR